MKTAKRVYESALIDQPDTTVTLKYIGTMVDQKSNVQFIVEQLGKESYINYIYVSPLHKWNSDYAFQLALDFAALETEDMDWSIIASELEEKL